MPKRILREHDDETVVHHDGVLSTHLTLCGWCDVGFAQVGEDVEVTCTECLKQVAYCVALHAKRKRPRRMKG